MSSLKVVLRKNKQRKDGTIPLAIRITRNRKTNFIFLKQYIKESDWDDKNNKVKKSHPNSTRLNNLILKKLSEINTVIIDKEVENKPVSAIEIKSKIKNQNQQNSFFDFADKYIDEKRKLGKHDQVTSENPRIKHFKTYLKEKDIAFNEITIPLLEQFKIHLKVKYNHSERTIMNHLILIRTIYNKAIKEGVTKQEYYPFGKNGVKIKIPKTLKIGLNIEEIEKIEQLDLPMNSEIWHTKNVFLFSFYFAGMRISDVLNIKWLHVIDGRLLYKMNKNDKSGGVKISQKAKKILVYYEKDKKNRNDFIFPELKKANLNSEEDMFKKVHSATRKFNKYLKKIAKLADIEKNITCHIARHSFGNIAGDKIPIQMLQKLYRHSDIQTTAIYQANFMFKDTDDALEAVIGK